MEDLNVLDLKLRLNKIRDNVNCLKNNDTSTLADIKGELEKMLRGLDVLGMAVLETEIMGEIFSLLKLLTTMSNSPSSVVLY